MEKTPEKTKEPSGPPTPRLVEGQLVHKNLEITSLLFSDQTKNVYRVQQDREVRVLIECHKSSGKPFPIPEGCAHLFPKFLDRFQERQRDYALFEDIRGQPFHESELPCWEPFLTQLLIRLAEAIFQLDQHGLDLTTLNTGDLYLDEGAPMFLFYPRAKTEKNSVDGALFQFVHTLLFHCLEPRTTRNLDKPLECLALSEYLDKKISAYLNEEMNAAAFLETLKTLIEEPDAYWEVQSQTDKGMIRERNEDSCGWLSSRVQTFRRNHDCHFLVVSDGLGGHHQGDVASHHTLMLWFAKMIRATLFRPESELENSYLKKVMGEVFDEVAEEIHHQKEFTGERWYRGRTRPGATLVGALLIGRLVFLGNCGDSRAYLIDEAGIRRLTTDHSVVQLYLERGQISEEEAFNHEHANIITSFMGTETRNYRRDLFVYRLTPGSRLLLCCDGLSDMLRDSEILEIVRAAKSARQGCRELVAAANERGGEDNVSVVLAIDRAVSSN